MADIVPAEKCGCGAYPRFDTMREADGPIAWFACPSPPRGCGRSGPPIAGDDGARGAAADAWDRMRRGARPA